MAAGRVVQVGATAGHARAEVRADRTEHDDRAAGHVLAAVRADALDHRLRPAVADREAHPGAPDEVQRPPVAPYRRVFPAIASLRGSATDRLGHDRDLPPEAFADVVVGLAVEHEVMPAPANAPNDWPAAPRSSRRTGPASSPRSSAPVTRRRTSGPRWSAEAEGPQRTLATERGNDAGLQRLTPARAAIVAPARPGPRGGPRRRPTTRRR